GSSSFVPLVFLFIYTQQQILKATFIADGHRPPLQDRKESYGEETCVCNHCCGHFRRDLRRRPIAESQSRHEGSHAAPAQWQARFQRRMESSRSSRLDQNIHQRERNQQQGRAESTSVHSVGTGAVGQLRSRAERRLRRQLHAFWMDSFFHSASH